jgi:tRNA-splicing endonuclease subunit Sen34
VRRKYRICGNLIGSLVDHPRNLNFKGIPAALNKFEIRLLIELGTVRLTDSNTLINRPTPEYIELFKRSVEKQYLEQVEAVAEKKRVNIEKHISQIVAGKRKKLLKQGIPGAEIKIDPDAVLVEEMEKIQTIETNERLVQIPNCKSFVGQPKHFEIEPCDLFKYNVFRDLWSRSEGFITLGDSFGCDFLLYPGDPLYFHASHTVHVMDKKHKIKPFDLIRSCRLSVIVNKVNLFAYENSNKEIVYQTIEWEGNVQKNPE